MTLPRLDDLPGFRRRIRIVPEDRAVVAAVEDDFHHMTVVLRHDGERILAVEAQTIRAPWTTCPGAEQVLCDTFIGVPLAEAARRGAKQANCTHLHDLAVFAAVHADETAAILYEALVADPVDGRGAAQIRRNGEVVLGWTLEGGMTLAEPAELSGRTVFELRDWIAGLDPARREAARILQWASLISHGRQIPLAEQSDATRMPPNCYTFQPDRAPQAVRVGEIIDFSHPGREPLEAI
jgi:hypothetical protein